MNIFLDTTQNEFVGCLFNSDFKIINKFIKETVYKVEEIPKFFTTLLVQEKINIQNVKNFYINVGPGSFTGSRISLVYVRTIAQITGANIFITNSFKLLNDLQNDLFIFANKNHSFKINAQDIDHISKTILVAKHEDEQKIDYLKLLNNFSKNIDLFKKTDIAKILPKYGTLPQIGAGK